MKRHFLLFIIMFIAHIGFSQSLCDNPDFEIPKIPNCERPVNMQVVLFNKMVSQYGLKDSISYTCTDGSISYSFQGKILNDWKYDPKLCGKKFMLRGHKTSINFQLLASIPLKGGKSQVYEFIRPEKERKRIIYKEYKEIGILPYGKYIERNCNGLILVEGEYGLKNISSSYSYSRYDDKIRKSVNENIDSKQTSVRKGSWRYFDNKGNLRYEEKYNKKGLKTNEIPASLCSKNDNQAKWNYYTSEKISPAIEKFNSINYMLDKNMHLSFDITHRGIVYYQNGILIKSPFFKMAETYKPWEFQMQHHGDQLLLENSKGDGLRAYIPFKKGAGEIVSYSDKSLEIYETRDYLPNGKFERRNCDGLVEVKGNYTSIDTLYSTSKETFDPNTYELTVVVTEFDHKTIKSGNWRYYSEDGALKLEEKYPGISAGTVYHDYLCISEKEKARKMAKNLSDPFILFNSICQIFGINNWINEDHFLNSTNYYLNGKILADVQVKDHPNNKKVITIKTPKTDIKIDIKTNDYAALGKKEKERKVIFNASISGDNGKGELLSFSGDKIKRYQTLNTVKSGLYEEKTCDGSLLAEGQYCHIKSFQRDTIVVFNPDTYQEEIQIVESDFIEKQVGVWKYYDNNGVLKREEDYGVCK